MDDTTGQHEHDRGRPDEVELEPASVVRSRRPRALWGVLAAAALAAGALAITAGGDDDAPPDLPVALGSASGAGRAEAADSSMLASFTYVAGEGLPSLGGEADAYRLAGTVSEDDVEALAAVLGVEGPTTRHEVGWRVQGTTATLEVVEGLGGQWSLYGASGDVAVAAPTESSGGGTSGCDPAGDTPCAPTTFVESEPALGGVDECTAADGPAECLTGECPSEGPCAVEDDPGCTPEECGLVDPEPLPRPIEPSPAADLPAEAEAREIALDLLASTGMEVTDAEVTVDGPYDAWYVMVEPRVDGLASGLLGSVSVGPAGEAIGANGYLGTPVRVGTYPILDTRATIDRANDAMADLGGGGGFSGDAGVTSSDTGAGGDVAEPTTTVCAALMPECGHDQAVDEAARCRALGTVCNPEGQAVPGQACTTQPDGHEICEVVACPSPTTIPGEAPPPELCAPESVLCPQTAKESGTTGSTDGEAAAPAVVDCVPPVEPMPAPEPGLPQPEPLEVVLVDAEPSLVLLGAIDGSADAYLVPGYRFTAEDGSAVDLPAVADDALAGPSEPAPVTTDTTDAPPPPDTVDPGPVDPCEVLVEADGSGTTHTVPPAPDCGFDPRLPDGAEPELGVGYYIDEVSTHCGWFVWAERWWATDEPRPLSWSGSAGTFTLTQPDEGTFVVGPAAVESATFTARGPADELPVCN